AEVRDLLLRAVFVNHKIFVLQTADDSRCGLCSTRASTLTKSTSTLTTSSLDSGVGVGVGGSWIAFRLGRPLFALEFLFGVCELTELPDAKSRAAITIRAKA